MSILDDAKVHYDRATVTLNFDSGELAAACSLLEEALKAKPDDTLLLTCYCAALSDLGRFLDAERILMKAVQLGSKERNTFFNLGVACMNINSRRNGAETWFKKAAQLSPDDQSWEAYIDFHAY